MQQPGYLAPAPVSKWSTLLKSAQTKYEEAIARNWPTFTESMKRLLSGDDEQKLTALAKSEVSILRTKVGLKKGDQRYDEQFKTIIATASNLLGNRKASAKKATKVEELKAELSSETPTKKDKKPDKSGKAKASK